MALSFDAKRRSNSQLSGPDGQQSERAAQRQPPGLAIGR
jgi:hypothetical protein